MALPEVVESGPEQRQSDEARDEGGRQGRDDLARVARGRILFVDRTVGEIANRQILKQAPRAFAAAKLEGPILAPIDPTQPLSARLPVRCADCRDGYMISCTSPYRAAYGWQRDGGHAEFKLADESTCIALSP